MLLDIRDLLLLEMQRFFRDHSGAASLASSVMDDVSEKSLATSITGAERTMDGDEKNSECPEPELPDYESPLPDLSLEDDP